MAVRNFTVLSYRDINDQELSWKEYLSLSECSRGTRVLKRIISWADYENKLKLAIFANVVVGNNLRPTFYVYLLSYLLHSYAKKAKELSSTFRHRLASPGAELVHWVEHVALTRGALHLRSSARGLHFYQKVYLDLIAVIFVLLFLVKACIKLLLKTLVKTNKMKVN